MNNFQNEELWSAINNVRDAALKLNKVVGELVTIVKNQEQRIHNLEKQAAREAQARASAREMLKWKDPWNS
jgi:hypothetical protein